MITEINTMTGVDEQQVIFKYFNLHFIITKERKKVNLIITSEWYDNGKIIFKGDEMDLIKKLKPELFEEKRRK